VSKLITLLFISGLAFSEEKIEYEKNQKIDLGALSVEGEVVTPGDFSIDADEKQITELTMFKRKGFMDMLVLKIEDTL
jgi:hypothetical protein